MNMKSLHYKRHRRQARQALRFGASAKPRHKLRAGRTGSVRRVNDDHDKRGKPLHETASASSWIRPQADAMSAPTFLGIPCFKCGNMLRYVSTGGCVACAKARSRESTGAKLIPHRVRGRR